MLFNLTSSGPALERSSGLSAVLLKERTVDQPYVTGQREKLMHGLLCTGRDEDSDLWIRL